MFRIKLNSCGKYFDVTDLETGKNYTCKFSFHQGHGNFKEFYVDVSNIPGSKLKKWKTLDQKFTYNEVTKKYEPNIFDLEFNYDLQSSKSKFNDVTNLF